MNVTNNSMGRKQQTTWLIILTAMTLMPSYALQGWLASGHNAVELPFWFWIAETVAWSLRALIEAAAILFLFQTITETQQQAYLLWGFKVALIALITLTLGPVVASTGLGLPLPEAMPRPLFWLWSFAIASYAPLMLGAVGVAYRIMPFEPVADMPSRQPLNLTPEKPRPPAELPSSEPETPTEKELPLAEVSQQEIQKRPTRTKPLPQKRNERWPPKPVSKSTRRTISKPQAPSEPLLEWNYHVLSQQQAAEVYYMLKNTYKLNDSRISELMGCSRNTLLKLKQKHLAPAINGKGGISS